MRINNQIVEALNAGLADLFYEVGLLSRLVNFESDEKLEEFINTEFERRIEMTSYVHEDGTVELLENELVSDEESLRDSLVSAMGQVGVKNSQELMDMLTSRYKTRIIDLETAQAMVKELRDDVAAVVQIDSVLNGLIRFGISSDTQDDIETTRDVVLRDLMEILLVKVEPTKEE